MRNTFVDPASKIDPVGISGGRGQYVLGHSQGELSRLAQQGAFYRDLTEDVLRRAGIEPGMRVLDIGCGVGDVSLIAGELVGPTGHVLGIDRSPEAIHIAERRAIESGQCYWVQFASADLETFLPGETFDAVIGRLVLMYLSDPIEALRRLSTRLNPGGIVAFQEMAMPLARSVPDSTQFSRCRGWILAAIGRAGFEVDMGGKLFETFLAAGLPAPQMISAARVEGGPASVVYDYLAETLRSLLPAMERLGIATAAEVGIDTLAERLRREAVEHTASIMLPPLIGAWARMPA
jgi:ubiquinone/menaquinone biosynthesis C-methylase UbiE